MKTPTTKFDAASYLETEEDIAAYLTEVMEINDPALTAEAIGTVARAHGMAKIAAETKVSRESLYKSLSLAGNPELKTVTKVLDAMGMNLQVVKKGIAGRPLKMRKSGIFQVAAKAARAKPATAKKTSTKKRDLKGARKPPSRQARA